MIDCWNQLIHQLNQMISRCTVSCVGAAAASGPSPKHTSSRSCKPLGFHLRLKGHRDSFSTRASISCSSKPAQIFGKVIGYGYEVPAWRPFWFETKNAARVRAGVGTMRLSVVAKCEFTHVGLRRWWKWEAATPRICDRTPWKSEPLFINLLLTSQRWRWRALQRSSLFYLASKPPPTYFFFLFCFTPSPISSAK